MSHTVFLERAKLPTGAEWQRVLTEYGSSLVFYPDFDPARASGNVPCTARDEKLGFEYFLQDIAEYIEEQEFERASSVRAFDAAVSFVTRGHPGCSEAAMAAATVLTVMTKGRFYNDESDDFLTIDEAIARGYCKDQGRPPAPPRPPGPPPPPPPQLYSTAVDIVARCVFRGASLTTLQTLEPTPRRFTIQTAVKEPQVRILSLWIHPVGKPSVHRVLADGVHWECDPKWQA